VTLPISKEGRNSEYKAYLKKEAKMSTRQLTAEAQRPQRNPKRKREGEI